MGGLNKYLVFRTVMLVLLASITGALWTDYLLNPSSTLLVWSILSTLLLPIGIYWQQRRYQQHIRKVLFLLDAIENNDPTIHYATEGTSDTVSIHQALNRVSKMLYQVKSETAQQEKYYELILDCVNTGIVVLNDNGAVYQHNTEALRLLGLEVFTHVIQLNKVDANLTRLFAECKTGDKLQLTYHNERNTVNLFVWVSEIIVREEHLRILALNDIHTELDEREIDSWIRLTRVLTHEIMNAVTPITSLSDTLLERVEENKGQAVSEEIHHGLETISTTGKGLLSFVESYRKFTHIPTPVPSLFYIKSFMERMMELSRLSYPDVSVSFHLDMESNDLILYADENLISQVVINLLKNAVQAIESKGGEEGNITIRAYCNEAEAILIEIANDGPAIPKDVAEHIFIPFFTTKEGGSGIGLSISRQIMRISGGSLTLLSGRKETTFLLTFN